jgi:predicted nucleotidyltransferase
MTASAASLTAITVDNHLFINDIIVTTSIVSALMGSEVKAKLLRWLYAEAPQGKGFSERALARHAGLSEGVVHRPLLALVEAQLLIKDDTDEGPRYRAPHEDQRLKYLFLFLRQDSEIVERLARAMKKLKTVQYACVFGSFVTGTMHKGSDIDVLVLENREDERTEVLAAFSALSKVIGREINPEIYSVEEFNANVAKGNSLSLSIASNRIDLKGVATWLK